jgi:hypothetical protein
MDLTNESNEAASSNINNEHSASSPASPPIENPLETTAKDDSDSVTTQKTGNLTSSVSTKTGMSILTPSTFAATTAAARGRDGGGKGILRPNNYELTKARLRQIEVSKELAAAKKQKEIEDRLVEEEAIAERLQEEKFQAARDAENERREHQADVDGTAAAVAAAGAAADDSEEDYDDNDHNYDPPNADNNFRSHRNRALVSFEETTNFSTKESSSLMFVKEGSAESLLDKKLKLLCPEPLRQLLHKGAVSLASDESNIKNLEAKVILFSSDKIPTTLQIKIPLHHINDYKDNPSTLARVKEFQDIKDKCSRDLMAVLARQKEFEIQEQKMAKLRKMVSCIYELSDLSAYLVAAQMNIICTDHPSLVYFTTYSVLFSSFQHNVSFKNYTQVSRSDILLDMLKNLTNEMDPKPTRKTAQQFLELGEEHQQLLNALMVFVKKLLPVFTYEFQSNSDKEIRLKEANTKIRALQYSKLVRIATTKTLQALDKVPPSSLSKKATGGSGPRSDPRPQNQGKKGKDGKKKFISSDSNGKKQAPKNVNADAIAQKKSKGNKNAKEHQQQQQKEKEKKNNNNNNNNNNNSKSGKGGKGNGQKSPQQRPGKRRREEGGRQAPDPKKDPVKKRRLQQQSKAKKGQPKGQGGGKSGKK